MPANEAMELDRALRGSGFPPAALSQRLLRLALLAAGGGPGHPRRAGAGGGGRGGRQPRVARFALGALRAVLRAGTPRELVRIPFLFDRQFGAQSIEKVAAAIGGVL